MKPPIQLAASRSCSNFEQAAGPADRGANLSLGFDLEPFWVLEPWGDSECSYSCDRAAAKVNVLARMGGLSRGLS